MAGFKTVTKLAEELSASKSYVVSTTDVSKVLVEMGLLSYVDKQPVLLNSEMGELVKKENFSYILWKEEILTNNDFLSRISAVKEPVVSAPVASTKADILLTVSELATALEIKPIDLNNILVNLNYCTREGKNFLINNSLGRQMKYENNFYVKWSQSIMSDPVFVEAVETFQKNAEGFLSETVSAIVPAPVIDEAAVPVVETSSAKTEKEAFKFDRKHFDAKFRTESGHYVRSRGEVIVANWLYNNDIMFAYEKRLPIVEEAYSDFYIKEKKVFIEVWGLESTKYLERKAKKIQMYNDNGFKLVGLDDSDIENIHDFLPLKLAKIGIILS